MKRWRCPECCVVCTVRPDTHWRRFLAARLIVLFSVMGKVFSGRWLASISRQRQQYWWRGYLRQTQMRSEWQKVKELFSAGLILSTHSLTHCEVTFVRISPNRCFAVTAGSSYG